MADDEPGLRQQPQNELGATGSVSSRRSSLLSSLFRRSLSLSDNAGNASNPLRPGRTRGYSESSLSDFEEDSNHRHLRDDFSQIKESGETEMNSRHRSLTTTDGAAFPTQESSRARSISLSAMFLGARTFGTDDLIGAPITDDDLNDSAFEDGTESAPSVIESDRDITQTDHLNKKLLNSFLNRINGVASKIFDPTGTGETSGQVFTDDVMMDRIIRRVESKPNDKQN